MKNLILTVSILFTTTAFAGLFGADAPPKDFLALKVSAVSSSRHPVTFTVEEFVKLLDDPSNGNKVSWDKTSNTWILIVKHDDKMTGQSSRLAWEFAKSKDNAVVMKMSADDTVLTSEVEILNGMQPYASVIEQLHAKKK